MLEPNFKRMIERPETWPNWPLLPVKRGRQNEDIGVLTADFPTIVIKVNLFQVNPVHLVINQLSNNGKVVTEKGEIETDVYDSIDALLAAGWVVD